MRTPTNRRGVAYLARAGIIAALYIVLTWISALFGLSGMGAIQLRISEALCILPIFTAAAVPGVTVGCLLANVFTGAALPDMHFPPEGKEPNAFVVICSDQKGRFVDIDTGIVAQTMLLRAVELGLNGICIANFDLERIVEILHLPSTPLMILAIGRGAEQIEVVDIDATESHDYYRRGECHIVPKVKIEDLIIE